MSEASKMGLLGSKEGHSSSNDRQIPKDDSPERYAPYSVDSDSETYDTEALSIMDINDIIGVQSEPVGESTLESEIAALSEIITEPEEREKSSTSIQKLAPTATLVKAETVEQIKTDDLTTPSENTTVIDASEAAVSDSQGSLPAKKTENDPINSSDASEQQKEAAGENETNSEIGISKSLQLIGESYLSDDSQASNAPSEPEPRVLFSCKRLVDTRQRPEAEMDFETLQDTIVEDLSADLPSKSASDHSKVKELPTEPEPELSPPEEEDKSLCDTENKLESSESPAQIPTSELAETMPTSEPRITEEPTDESPMKTDPEPTDEQPSTLETPETVEEDVPTAEEDKIVEEAPIEVTEDTLIAKMDESHEQLDPQTPEEASGGNSRPAEDDLMDISVENAAHELEEVQITPDSSVTAPEEPMEVSVSEEEVPDIVPIELEDSSQAEEVVELVSEVETEPLVEQTAEESENIYLPVPEDSDAFEAKPPASIEPKCPAEQDVEYLETEEPTELEKTPPEIQDESDEPTVSAEIEPNSAVEVAIDPEFDVTDALTSDETVFEAEKPSEDDKIDAESVESVIESKVDPPELQSDEINDVIMSEDALADELTAKESPERSEDSPAVELLKELAVSEDKPVEVAETEENIEESMEKSPIPESETVAKSQDTIDDIFESTPSVESFKAVDEAMEKVFSLSADMPMTADTFDDLQTIDTVEEKLPITDLEDPTAPESMDTLDALLELDLIPPEDSTDVVLGENTLDELVDKEQTPLLSMLLPKPDSNSVNEGDVLLSESIDSLNDSEFLLNVNDAKTPPDNLELLDEVKECDDEVLAGELNPLVEPELDVPFAVIPEEKLDLPDDILSDLDVEAPANPEISEIESAVKFLQESQDNEDEMPTELSPKAIEGEIVELTERDTSSSMYSASEKLCDDPTEMIVDLEPTMSDSIAISEAEIINEAAKLENEKKLHEESKIISVNRDEVKPDTLAVNVSEENKSLDTLAPDVEVKQVAKSTTIPKTSILEERLREPPKIEIPVVEPARIYEAPTTPKASLLIPRDSRVANYQKMAESPKGSTEKLREEVKTETSRKEPEHESIGSPRIILKIAKSALTDCGEPKSPKSPKIFSGMNSPNPEDSPGQKLGKIKLKLSKGGHPSIISSDKGEEGGIQWHKEGSCSLSPLGVKIKLSKTGDASIVQAEKFDSTEDRRLESPLGMKLKLSRAGDIPAIQQDLKDAGKYKMEAIMGSPKRTESPLGMKIKLSKSGDASIVQPEDESRLRERSDTPQELRRTESPLGMKIKLHKTGDASILMSDHEETKKIEIVDSQKRNDSQLGVKIKLTKKGGASVVTSDTVNDKMDVLEIPRRTESPLGMKFKLSKSGDASIIHSEIMEIHNDRHRSEPMQLSPAKVDNDVIVGTPKRSEASIGMKIKLSKGGDATIVHPAEELPEPRRAESTMKIKLSKSGDASIVQPPCIEISPECDVKPHKTNDSTTTIELMKIKLSKTGHPTIVGNDAESAQKFKEIGHRAEVTIEPIQLIRRLDSAPEIAVKRKDVTMSPVESKKAKLEAKLSQMLPEVTIQPVVPKEPAAAKVDQSNSSAISRQQMNVINQEISITQLRPNTADHEVSMSEKLKNMLTQSSAEVQDDCEIIEHHPELIIVNENSNSSQDIMIIDEVPALRIPEVKTPKKRGRPRRNALQFPPSGLQQDPLALDEAHPAAAESERPKRTCRNQRSYAPPKRGRGRGRGKRKYDRHDAMIAKRARLTHDLQSPEECTMITLDDDITDGQHNSELYKALRQPLKNTIIAHGSVAHAEGPSLLNSRIMAGLDGKPRHMDNSKKSDKDAFGAPDRQNWLTPSSKRYNEMIRSDTMSTTVQVIDEETRMSAEPTSRSQTPARNLAGHGTETIINEESQGSVLSTATTESEKVKVKNRRMEINFDPDEGPFTVDKIAEYEWPIDRKGETFMIQEQISQYLGVKSFKRKYPDLKRRMVDMEERNYLRENGLVSESMCDMGLTAIHSSEVLDIMCSDFPDQYEEYRKHMRERQIKEHSKKQKELSAAATAEKNRIDLAEMAVQSALSWNVNLNKARKETRRCSLDLQTFTIHVPKKQQKVEETRVSHYPVALIPGQFTDYYREYTPAELRYYPLNTVLYGPMKPNERKFDSQSEGSQSDSDSDSSSDDSSCSSSEGTQDTEESQSTMDDVDIELSNQKDKSLKCKMCLKNLNKSSKSETLIQCGTCNGYVHPSCIDLTLDMVPHIQAYAWQCTDCKTCAQCHDPADEDKMLFCDMCDRGYHIYCVGLRRVPQGRWHCQECAVCGSCGSREAGGVNAERNSVAQWQHEYKKGDKNTRVYISTLCVPCSKLWRKGRYCPHCSRCHNLQRPDLDETLVHCSACDKYLHLECVESKDLIAGKKSYQCDVCVQSRQRIAKSSSKVIRA